MRYLILALLLAIGNHCSAQMLKGTITSTIDHKPLEPVTVVNQATQQAIYTDSKGQYTIPAKSGDKIAFTFIGYKPVIKVVPPSLGTAELDVALSPLSYQLQEFTVHSRNLTKFQLDSVDRAQTYGSSIKKESTKYGVSYGGGLAVDGLFSALSGAISGNAKKWKRLNNQFHYFEQQRFIDTRYTTELVTSLTGLTGDTEAHFMNGYPMPYDFARAASDLELKMWIRNNYKTYLNKLKDSTANLSADKP